MCCFKLSGDIIKLCKKAVEETKTLSSGNIKLSSKVRAYSKLAGIFLEGEVVAITRHYLQPDIFTIRPISHLWRDFNISSPHLINLIRT